MAKETRRKAPIEVRGDINHSIELSMSHATFKALEAAAGERQLPMKTIVEQALNEWVDARSDDENA